MLYSKEDILIACQRAQSCSDVCRILGLCINGRDLAKVKKWIDDYSIDVNHFVKSGAEKSRKYPLVEKECPICKSVFITSKGAKKEKKTCSYACSNTLFRSGSDNGNYINGLRGDFGYRAICFQHYDRKCAICGWDKSIDVHHIDSNSENNSPKNLIPLCANHHRLTVMLQYKDEIQLDIDRIVNTKFT